MNATSKPTTRITNLLRREINIMMKKKKYLKKYTKELKKKKKNIMVANVANPPKSQPKNVPKKRQRNQDDLKSLKSPKDDLKSKCFP